ncbi:MAG: ATP-dependent sacrificial sulfur transferase LarE [Candidatus Eisenbacteria bacterium]|nr:ATP-dependent sacrificial sulfur transferase LarE [Candidatus Eisenbacteria bacterium]
MQTAADSGSATDLAEGRYRALVAHLRAQAPLVVAFSGGVDSAFLLAAAVDATPGQVRAILGVSPSLSAESHAMARAVAAQIGVALEEVSTPEMESAAYVANAGDRCFHCKNTLYSVMGTLARAAEGERMLDGTNADDLGDHRPGRRAAALHGVKSPLAELGWSKEEIRAQSRRLGLPTWDRPASPCLSSRIPVGIPVTVEALRAIEALESGLKQLGFPVVRARHHGGTARVEVPLGDLERLEGLRGKVEQLARDSGYDGVALDPEGYRVGGAGRVAPAEGQRRKKE